jgi:uncharacterized repeat protein (TIGR03833 family)
MDGKTRNTIHPGLRVSIELKEDQRSGKRTEGIVQDILTNSPNHPHGIKVRLESGQVGRVQEILDAESGKQPKDRKSTVPTTTFFDGFVTD